MNIYECIVIIVAMIILGLWGLVWLSGKTGLLEEEKKNVKKAYEDNLKKVSGQDLVKAEQKARKTVERSLKGKDTSAVKVEVKAGVRTKKSNDLKFPELPKEVKKTPAKRGRPSKKGGHLD